MDTPLFEFLDPISGTDSALAYLQARSLLKTKTECGNCGSAMSIKTLNTVKLDKRIFRCSNSTCRSTKSVRSDSFFCKMKEPMPTIIMIMFMWISQLPASVAAVMCGMERHAVIRYYQYCREICTWKLLNLKPQLGAGGGIVQVDETLTFKRKNKVAREKPQGWVLGAYDSNLNKGVCRYVPRKNAHLILPIIQSWVVPGVEIHTDMWRAYDGLEALGFTHQTVEDTSNFIDPTTGSHTNHVESFWSRIKGGVIRVSGSVGKKKWEHLDEAMYREWYGMTASTIMEDWERFLQHVAEKTYVTPTRKQKFVLVLMKRYPSMKDVPDKIPLSQSYRINDAWLMIHNIGGLVFLTFFLAITIFYSQRRVRDRRRLRTPIYEEDTFNRLRSAPGENTQTFMSMIFPSLKESEPKKSP